MPIQLKKIPGGRPAALAFVLTTAVALDAGCLVESQCRADYDCPSGQSCNSRSGACYLECSEERDCYVNGASVGKSCSQNKCRYLFDERVAAPDFCLADVNPKSTTHGSSVCLSALKGKVVLLFFGLLA
jgi:Cys-rich repeat protein